METRLIWKNRSFGNYYEILSSGKMIGELKTNSWGKYTTGELNSTKLKFCPKGILNQKTEIKNTDNDTVLGVITYNFGKSKGTIEYANGEMEWRWVNFWNNELIICSHTGTMIKYAVSPGIGEIIILENDEFLLLSGLQIINRHRQILASALYV